MRVNKNPAYISLALFHPLNILVPAVRYKSVDLVEIGRKGPQLDMLAATFEQVRVAVAPGCRYFYVFVSVDDDVEGTYKVNVLKYTRTDVKS